jgi:hypothetical protein
MQYKADEPANGAKVTGVDLAPGMVQMSPTVRNAPVLVVCGDLYILCQY